MTDTDYETLQDALARAYDPDAFKDHPIEQRSHVAAIQWAARRKLATDAAAQALPLFEALVEERDALQAQLDNMTTETRSVVSSLADHRLQRRVVGPWVEVTD